MIVLVTARQGKGKAKVRHLLGPLIVLVSNDRLQVAPIDELQLLGELLGRGFELTLQLGHLP